MDSAVSREGSVDWGQRAACEGQRHLWMSQSATGSPLWTALDTGSSLEDHSPHHSPGLHHLSWSTALTTLPIHLGHFSGLATKILSPLGALTVPHYPSPAGLPPLSHTPQTYMSSALRPSSFFSIGLLNTTLWTNKLHFFHSPAQILPQRGLPWFSKLEPSVRTFP
jgi:hypothetical protein